MDSATLIANLRMQIGGPRDGALLRFSLANALAGAGDSAAAAQACRDAVAFDPAYSAAWKLLGKSLAAVGDAAGAIDAYERGIEVAAAHGDKQAEKEMRVFLQRLKR